MKRTVLVTVAGLSAMVLAFSGCGSGMSMGTATSLYEQLGGKEVVSKLANNLVSSSMKDPRLSGLLGNVNPTTASTKMSDQLCSALGGGCQAPYSDQQVASAANRLSPEQKSAVSDNFTSSLNSVTSNPAVREAVTKALGSKMGGILGAVL